MTQEFEVKQIFTVDYAPDSEEFKNVLADYRECIDSTADAEDVVKAAVMHVARFGAERMCEGVGYIEVDGRIHGEPFALISIETGYEDIDEI